MLAVVGPIMTRRQLIRLALAPVACDLFAPFRALALQHRDKVKITGIKAMQIGGIANNTLVKVETDAGLTGYGEAGASGPMARARIDTMKQYLIGQDPLAIERHFHELTTIMHTYMAHIPTISGIDIALWDLAGKILNRPVVQLLGGPFRDSVGLYSHGGGFDLQDLKACRAWVDGVKTKQEGFTAFKIAIAPVVGSTPGRFMQTLDSAQLRRVARAFQNLREAAGDSIDFAVHCHNEFDAPSAIGIARAVESANPLFLEDPLNVPFSGAWVALRRASRVPLLSGEKLEMVSGFRPFLDNEALDILQPDLAFAGGISGVRRIAHYAALSRVPVALHNVGSLVLTHASAHFGAAIQNFYRSESALGWPRRMVEELAAGAPPQVRGGNLTVPSGPGLGLDLNAEVLKRRLLPGEPWWG